MTNSEIIGVISIVSALTSATLVTYFNYRFGITSKRLDLLYTHRLTAFKEVTAVMAALKNFCNGKIAYLEGAEYAPFYVEGNGALHHRILLTTSVQTNAVFLTGASRASVDDLVAQLGGLCSGEVAQLTGTMPGPDLLPEYSRIAIICDDTINVLSREIGLL